LRCSSEIKKDISKAVKVLISQEPEISEIRLFGSYGKGNFNEKSDIDVGIFVTDTQKYFYKITERDYFETPVVCKDGSIAVKKLRNSIYGKVSFPEKYSIHVLNKIDFPYFPWSMNMKVFYKEVSKGKLLYRNE